MDERFLWPLAGVFLGWLLNSITNARKNREENRQLIGRLLSILMGIYSDVRITNNTNEKIKDFAGSWERFESLRQHTMNKHFLEPASKINLLDKSIYEMSGAYPVESVQIQSLKTLLLKTKNTFFSSTSKIDKEKLCKDAFYD